MTLSMYQACVPGFVRQLSALSAILNKAATDAEARKIDPLVFTSARLAPDMFPLSRQVQIATDGAKGCAARLAGLEIPSYPDTETTFPELQNRIAKTIAFLKSVPEDKFEGCEDRKIVMKVGGRELEFTGRSYLFDFVIPNVYFHVTTAYAILRHNGVQIGKQDFLMAA